MLKMNFWIRHNRMKKSTAVVWRKSLLLQLSFITLSLMLLCNDSQQSVVVVHAQPTTNTDTIVPINVYRNLEQQLLYEEYCIDNENKTTLSKVYMMQRMCMCGFLRDAIHPQIELHSIIQQNTTQEGVVGVEKLNSNVPMIECINNTVITNDQIYPCENIHLLSFLNLQDISNAFIGTNISTKSQSTSSIWGYYDTIGNEIALIGTYYGLAFVDVTTPNNPIYFGTLEPPSNGGYSFWRDVRVYNNYIYTVTENGRMQYLDMNTILNLRNTNQIPMNGILLKQYAKEYGTNITKTHTIDINVESGYAYLVGSNLCSGGLYIVNITIPSEPAYAGCFDDDGYTHEVTCVIYKGKDIRYRGREICFACNADTVTIVDVTNKENPVMLSRLPYIGARYTHQGWLDEKHNYFIFGDELDELNSTGSLNTKTLVLDVTDLLIPKLIGSHIAPNTKAVDHNQYIIGNYTYQATYRAGLRILRINNYDPVNFTEVAYFDIFPLNDDARFNGAWGVYPFFPSGNIIVSGIEQGLFVLKAGLQLDKPSTTVSYGCSVESKCRIPIIDFILGIPIRYTIHRIGLFNRCVSRCVTESTMILRKSQGWKCGGC